MKAAPSSPSSPSNKAMLHNPLCKPLLLNDLLNPDSFKCSERTKSTATLDDPHQPSPPQPTHELIPCVPRKSPPTNTAMSLQSEDVLTFVEILDQVSGSNGMWAPPLITAQAFGAPNMALDLRSKSVRILQRVCGSQSILPHSFVLSDNISKEGNITFTSGGSADVWKGLHNGKRVRITAFRTYTTENLSKVKQVRNRWSHM